MTVLTGWSTGNDSLVLVDLDCVVCLWFNDRLQVLILVVRQLEKVVGKMAAAVERLISENKKLRQALQETQARSPANQNDLPEIQFNIDEDDDTVVVRSPHVNSADDVGDVQTSINNDEQHEQ